MSLVKTFVVPVGYGVLIDFSCEKKRTPVTVIHVRSLKKFIKDRLWMSQIHDQLINLILGKPPRNMGSKKHNAQ